MQAPQLASQWVQTLSLLAGYFL